ncbi:MAG: class I SAM-dependent methyltransferase [Candidatus Woesearchaeota archaeon]|jgi:release factor glutamine methyltransferase
MVTNTSKITSEFVQMINSEAKKGTYRVNLNGILIDVFPYVFPPQSAFSESTHTLYDQFGHLQNKKVLDIGTGTGIQAIQATKAGANAVDAIDIYDNAVKCAKHNVRLNGLENKIQVWQSDLFNKVSKKEYDLIIANLPIVDKKESDLRFHSLFDPNFIYHERLFKEASKYLSNSGKINLCHSNLQSEGFQKLESLAKKYKFNYIVKQKNNSLGYEWRNYEFTK